MKAHLFLIVVIASTIGSHSARAATIDRATITEVVNSVNVIEPATKRTNAAKAQQIFTAPNVMRTGPDSRAEMVAADQTVTRVGQNTLFSFEPNSREINLQRGSVLFNSPSGKGGGTIRTPAASAAVLGTTVIVVTTRNGGFKVLVIEGKCRVKDENGVVRILKAGELVYLLPGGKISGIFEFRLSQQVGASNLVRGFKSKLPSAGNIAAAISKQEKDISGGLATPTNLIAGSGPNTAYQVDVARGTQIETDIVTAGADGSPFQTAISSDAVVFGSTPEPARLFGPALPEQTEFPFDRLAVRIGDSATGPDFLPAANQAQFFGDNIVFATSAVDLSAFAANDVFQYAAIRDILFDGTTDFGSLPGQLQLFAGGDFRFRRGSSVTADTPKFILLAFGSELPSGGLRGDPSSAFSTDVPFMIRDTEVRNRGGDLIIRGGDILVAGSQLASKGSTNIVAARDLRTDRAVNPVSQFTVGDGIAVPPGDSVIGAATRASLAAGRHLDVRHTGIGAPRIRIESGTSVRMNEVLISDLSNGRTLSQFINPGAPAIPVPPTVLVSTRNLVELNKVNFLSRDTLIQGRTIALSSVKFGNQSRVTLESGIGRLAPQPNTGRPAIPGLVNFINNVRYGTAPAEQFVRQNGPGVTTGGPGIFIRPRRD